MIDDKVAVLIGFLLFIALVLYLRVPTKIAGMLDARSNRIREQLDEARSAREEAETLLASFERKQRDVEQQADEIVERAKVEARTAAEQAKADIASSIERKLAGAEERIAQAEASAAREVRNTAAATAVAAAREVLGGGMDVSRGDSLLDDGISTVAARLN